MSSQTWIVCVLLSMATVSLAEDWPQWRGPRRDGTWHDANVIERFSDPVADLAWTVPIGAGYSGPTVAEGRVFVTDRIVEPREMERIHCFSLENGKELWTHAYDCPYEGISYPAGPRASVCVDGGLAYALGSTGWMHCMDARDGSVVWKRDLNADYDIVGEGGAGSRMPVWGISASPLIVDNLMILHIGGRNGACVVALDKTSGREAWRALNDRAQYSAPILVQQAGKQVVVVWTGDSISGLAPETGEVYWRHEFTPIEMPIGVATPIVNGDLLFVTSFYDGSMMLQLDQEKLTVRELWHARGRSEQDTEALHSIISTPIWRGTHIYGVDSYGELRCLEAESGDRVWEDRTATPRARWSTIHFVSHGEDVWMFNERGELLITRLSPEGFQERSRTKLIRPTLAQLRRREGVCWAHPAFADGRILARNDEELVCFDARKP